MKKEHETPVKENNLTPYKKKVKIEGYFRKIMETLGLDLDDDSLKDTPRRVAKMYVDEIFKGLNPDNFPKITTVENKMGLTEPVAVMEITLNSNCEHHFVPIMGKCYVSYIPKAKILGLSKINRLVQFYGARPQIQERLNLQILSSLQDILETEDVAVVIDAVHLCVRSRGIKDTNSYTRTQSFGGEFLVNQNRRDEFLRSIPTTSCL